MNAQTECSSTRGMSSLNCFRCRFEFSLRVDFCLITWNYKWLYRYGRLLRFLWALFAPWPNVLLFDLTCWNKPWTKIHVNHKPSLKINLLKEYDYNEEDTLLKVAMKRNWSDYIKVHDDDCSLFMLKVHIFRCCYQILENCCFEN